MLGGPYTGTGGNMGFVFDGALLSARGASVPFFSSSLAPLLGRTPWTVPSLDSRSSPGTGSLSDGSRSSRMSLSSLSFVASSTGTAGSRSPVAVWITGSCAVINRASTACVEPPASFASFGAYCPRRSDCFANSMAACALVLVFSVASWTLCLRAVTVVIL